MEIIQRLYDQEYQELINRLQYQLMEGHLSLIQAIDDTISYVLGNQPINYQNLLQMEMNSENLK